MYFYITKFNALAKIANIDLGDFPLLLAPMEDVSDPPFRALCKAQGCDMMYTEFISSEGLIRDAHKSVQKLGNQNINQDITMFFPGVVRSIAQSSW